MPASGTNRRAADRAMAEADAREEGRSDMFIDSELEERARALLGADDGTFRDGAFFDAAGALHYWTAAGPALLMDVERRALLDCVEFVGRVLHMIADARERAKATASAPEFSPHFAPRPGIDRAQPVARKLSMADREGAIRQAIGAPT